ncbi:MAG: radical family protein [Deltaproteobacteria bacterium]|nr:radical family protein [Deltaproteobacteria bacterium]
MKIQFVNPHNDSNMYAAPKFFRHASRVSASLNFNANGALFPPLNLAILAALTPREHQVAIDDGCLGTVGASRSADLVAITAMTAQAPAAYDLADQYRSRGIPVVLGGVHPSMCPEEAAQHADSVVIGEADRLWPELVQDFDHGRMKSRYCDSEAVDLATLALPRRDLLDRNGYVIFNSVQTTRGCPFNCNFCSVTSLSGVKYRFRPVEKVVEEIRALDSRFVYFIDDNIIGVPRRSKELFKALLPLKLAWASQVTVNFARDPELMRLARESGCYGVFIGFESVSNNSIRDAGKGVNRPDEYLRDVDRIHQAGITVWGSFIFGFDHDTLDTFRDTLHFIEKSKMEFAQFSLLQPCFDSMRRSNGSLTGTGQNTTLDPSFSIIPHSRRNGYILKRITPGAAFTPSARFSSDWVCPRLKVISSYWTWKEAGSGVLTQPLPLCPRPVVKAGESGRLVRVRSSGG